MMKSNLFTTGVLMLSVFFSISAFAVEDYNYEDFSNVFEDKDLDGVPDESDNCPHTFNPSQDDSDRDGIGDVCDEDDCGCQSESQLIYVCQDGMTRRIECSGLNDDITHCGPCETNRVDPCTTCTPDEDGRITFCIIPQNPENLRTVRGECNEVGQFFNADGSFKNPDNVCGPCNCALVGDVDTDGDGECDRTDECPTDPTRQEAGMCGCDDQDSDSDWVCDSEDICPGGNDKNDDDGDGIPNLCDVCPGFDDAADMDGDGIPDGCDQCMIGDSDNDGVCDDVDVCLGFDDNADMDGDGIPDACDSCAVGDSDNDGVCDDMDICLGFDDNADMDGDGVPDGCDDNNGNNNGDTGFQVCETSDTINTDVLFVIDNSQSISIEEYSLFEQTIVATIANIQANCPTSRVAVMHYGGSFGQEVSVELDFENGRSITAVQRQFCVEQPCPSGGDDLNAAMEGAIALMNSGSLSHIEENELELVIFSDAFTGLECEGPGAFVNCSQIDPYTGIDALKSAPFNASVTVIGATIQAEASRLALYASPGGSFSDVVLDPVCDQTFDGCTLPRQYIPVEFDSPVAATAAQIASLVTCGARAVTMNDSDNDGICDDADVCMGFDDNIDSDGDGIPDGCDNDTDTGMNDNDCNVGDSDNDGVCDDVDICLGFDDNADMDGDGIPDGCDSCPVGDSDNDGVCDNVDICLGFDDNADVDGDGIPDGCDQCNAGDVDNDGICDDVDVCLQGNDNFDVDLDGVPDACDPCPIDFLNDFDGDGVCDSSDLCQGSDDNADMDGDGIPDGCDTCPFDPSNDSDGDGVCDSDDICPNGDDNVDTDGNGIPDACDENKTFCDIQGDSRFEWIDDVKIGNVFNQSGNNGGYADFSDIVVDFEIGESFDVWINTGFFEDIAEISHYGYIDWNCDGDFDDAEEFVFLSRSIEETGGFITVPSFAVTDRPLRFRIIATYGRIDNACDPCVSGEVEDYSLFITNPSAQVPDNNGMTGQAQTTSQAQVNIQVMPNPTRVGTGLVIQIEGAVSSNATAALIDLQGNVFHRTVMREGYNRLSTDDLEAGVYILEYTDGNDIQRIMVIIQD